MLRCRSEAVCWAGAVDVPEAGLPGPGVPEPDVPESDVAEPDDVSDPEVAEPEPLAGGLEALPESPGVPAPAPESFAAVPTTLRADSRSSCRRPPSRSERAMSSLIRRTGWVPPPRPPGASCGGAASGQSIVMRAGSEMSADTAPSAPRPSFPLVDVLSVLPGVESNSDESNCAARPLSGGSERTGSSVREPATWAIDP
ncbi:Uncharacterised protein [Mycobacteroides abscessus subsp. abscessus]|nr:Uncharacterised protein [Mycobacteroides abscessus subsp. abscessus]